MRNAGVLIRILIPVSLVLAATLRLSGLEHMEYKSDQEYMFEHVVRILDGGEWDRLGMPSGVSIRNPGMSIWVYALLGMPGRLDSPVDLARRTAWLNLAALVLFLVFVIRVLPRASREAGLWALALACVNPLSVLYHRVIWAQSTLPFFCMLFWIGWWYRRRLAGAALWGATGAALGQIHMSGFFLAAAVWAWTLPAEARAGGRERMSGTAWGAWILASAMAAVPLIPWIAHVFSERAPSTQGFAWELIPQLRFYVFWLSNAFGLHLGYALGVHEGGSVFAQNAAFIRYPLLAGEATYGVAAAYGVCVIASAVTLGGWCRRAFRREVPARAAGWRWRVFGDGSSASLMLRSVLVGCGALMTVSALLVRRHYLLVAFPLLFLWTGRIAFGAFRREGIARGVLISLWSAQLLLSGAFLQFISLHEGAPAGDYGVGYSAQREDGR